MTTKEFLKKHSISPAEERVVGGPFREYEAAFSEELVADLRRVEIHHTITHANNPEHSDCGKRIVIFALCRCAECELADIFGTRL